MKTHHRGNELNRRDFLKKTGLSMGASAALWSLAASASAQEKASESKDSSPAKSSESSRQTMPQRTLGRTGLKVSEIAFGGGGAGLEPQFIEMALGRGINYIDTAAGYGQGQSETTIGKVMSTRRKDVTLTTKLHPRETGPTAKKEDMMRGLEESLKRLQTDHVDVCMIHGVDDVARIENPEVPEFFQQARQAGKIRFSGFSSHASPVETFVEVLRRGIESNIFDVILMKYNAVDVQSAPEIDSLIQKAVSQGMGIIAMKVDADRFKPENMKSQTFRPKVANIKWALHNPNVTSVLMGMKTVEGLDEAVGAAGEKITRAEFEAVHRYAVAAGSAYCGNCSVCTETCPERLALG